MKKKSLFIAIATLFFISISSAMIPTACVDIYNECVDLNPYDPDNGVHEQMAWYGYWQGCLGFFDACIDQT